MKLLSDIIVVAVSAILIYFSQSAFRSNELFFYSAIVFTFVLSMRVASQLENNFSMFVHLIIGFYAVFRITDTIFGSIVFILMEILTLHFFFISVLHFVVLCFDGIMDFIYADDEEESENVEDNK